MKKFFLSLAVILIYAATFAQTTESIYEKAKLQMICKAVAFNCEEQGKPDVADKLDCSNFEKLEESLPTNFKSSRRIISTFKSKKYTNYNTLEARLDKLMADVAEELRKIGNVVKNSKAEKSKWQTGVDNLLMIFTRYKDEALAEAKNLPQDEIQNTTSQNAEDSSEDISTERPTENTENTQDITDQSATEYSGGNTGIWIMAIMSILLAFGSIGYAYMVKSTVAHRIRQAELMFKERYAHLDDRMDRLVTKEEMKNFGSTLENHLVKTTKIQTTTEKSEAVKESALKQAYEQLINESPFYYAKFYKGDGGFLFNEFAQTPSKECFYEIEIDSTNHNVAYYQIINDPNMQQVALNYADMLLEQACFYLNDLGQSTQIVTVERGLLQKEGNIWKIIERAKIKFV